MPQGAGLDMLNEVLGAACASHLVQLQSLQPKRNLPSDASWFSAPAAGDAAQQTPPFAQVLLPGVDVLGAGCASPDRQSNGLASPGGST